MLLADGTIKKTIHKQAGHGPYLWAVVYLPNDAGIDPAPRVSIYSFWEDAKKYADAITANGHAVLTIDLAVDNTRLFKRTRT